MNIAKIGFYGVGTAIGLVGLCALAGGAIALKCLRRNGW